MSFQHACFISYRSGSGELLERIVTDLADALRNELALQLDAGVFLDRERLQGGEFFNEALARNLCKCACMVVVFTPRYFNLRHSYCAREYRAMEELETTRLASLRGTEFADRGLIIPVVVRGRDVLPPEIANRRHVYDFQRFQLSDEEMTRHAEYAPKIREIAEYIALVYRALDVHGAATEGGCDEFRFPNVDEIQDWLSGVIPEQGMVGFPSREPTR